MKYLEAIVEAYPSLRRSGLFLSPADCEQVRQWQERGIPLDTLLRVLAEGLDRFRASNRGEGAPRSLRWFRALVEERATEARELSVGTPSLGENDTRSWLVAQLESLGDRLREVEGTAPPHVFTRASEALRGAGVGGWEAVERARAEVAVARASALPARERRALGADLRSAVGRRPTGVTPAAHRDTLRALLGRWV